MDNEGNTVWAWQAQEFDGRWSMVGALVEYGDGTAVHQPLIHRSREVVQDRLRPVAMEHAVRTHQPLRLARFDISETIEEFRPDD